MLQVWYWNLEDDKNMRILKDIFLWPIKFQNIEMTYSSILIIVIFHFWYYLKKDYHRPH